MEHIYQDPALLAGANLKRLIKNSRWKTQEEFAFEFGTDVRTVGRWIRGGINSLATIQQLAVFFDIDWRAFFSE